MLMEPHHFEPQSPSRRWPSYRPLVFRVKGGRRRHESIVTERSLHEMVLRVPRGEHLPVGTCLRPINREMAQRHGFRRAVVRRIEQATGQSRLVLIEILS